MSSSTSSDDDHEEPDTEAEAEVGHFFPSFKKLILSLKISCGSLSQFLSQCENIKCKYILDEICFDF